MAVIQLPKLKASTQGMDMVMVEAATVPAQQPRRSPFAGLCVAVIQVPKLKAFTQGVDMVMV